MVYKGIIPIVFKKIFHFLRLEEDKFFMLIVFCLMIICYFYSDCKTNSAIKKMVAILKVVKSIRKMRLMLKLWMYFTGEW